MRVSNHLCILTSIRLVGIKSSKNIYFSTPSSPSNFLFCYLCTALCFFLISKYLYPCSALFHVFIIYTLYSFIIYILQSFIVYALHLFIIYISQLFIIYILHLFFFHISAMQLGASLTFSLLELYQSQAF